MMPAATPIALFAYNRPDHLRRTLDALKANVGFADHPVYAFADGPKSARDRPRVQEVRALLNALAEEHPTTLAQASANQGLATSIIGGVSRVVEEHDQVIVMEDDLVTSPYFLTFMEDALRLYASSPQVASVHGYVYPLAMPLPETFFLRGADCWGWATWRRAWQHFEPDPEVSYAALHKRGLAQAFNANGARNLMQMLEHQMGGKVDSWAIRWHASAFLAKMYTLYPGRSLVHNIGNDASGTHSSATGDYAVQLSRSPVKVKEIPIHEDPEVAQGVENYFRRLRQPWPLRVAGFLRNRLLSHLRRP